MSFPLSVPIPAIRGHFGNGLLRTFQTQIRPDEIKALLGHDPRGEQWKRLSPELREIYEKVQRKTKAARRDSIEGYLENRLVSFRRVGAFPAICIGMTNPPHFEEGVGVRKDVGVLHLNLGEENTRMVLDGLGRVSGGLKFLEETPDAKEMFTFATTIFAPHEDHGQLTLDELGQLFFDFNFRAQRISGQQAMALDQSDIYLLMTNAFGKSEVISQHGGMEKGRMSLGSKSTAIVVQAVLLRFVRGACEGAKAQKSNNAPVENPRLTPESFETIRSELETFLETFAEQMGGKTFENRESLHLSSVGWQALGLVAHDLYIRLPQLDAAERGRIAKEVAEIDWSRDNRDMIRIGVLSEVNGEIGMSGRGVAAVQALHNYIREKTRLGAMLPKEQEPELVA